MQKHSRHFVLIATVLALGPALPAERATLTGKVADAAGSPLSGATVLVYPAGLKHRYSTFCPSCYADCGKRALTDASGAFTIASLDPDLRFELLVIHEGYAPGDIGNVDPSRGPAPAVALKPRAPVDDPARVVRGVVVDAHGRPVRDAVLEPEGIETDTGSLYGWGSPIDGLEPVAVTNAKGEFDLASAAKARGVLLRVEARGMAVKLVAAPTGETRTTIPVSEGAVVRGRLVNRGKPVPGAEIGLIAQDRGGGGANLKIVGNPYPEIRIGTQNDGTFVIPNVPANAGWYVYGKMQSIAPLGGTVPVACATWRDGEVVDVGDIPIEPGHSFGGKVTLIDGAAVRGGMTVTIASAKAMDEKTAPIGRDGSFDFKNLPAGPYQIIASVRGYQLQGGKFWLDTTVERDTKDFAVVLEPAGHR